MRYILLLLIQFSFFFRIAYSFENLPENHLLNMDQSYQFVSLGCSCDVAYNLKLNNQRHAAFPFDWLLTLNHKKFIELLDNDFQYFLDASQFFRYPNSENWGAVENICYEIEFRHDQLIEPQGTTEQIYTEQLKTINNKYTRRVDRFRQLKNFKGKVFFIRCAYDFTYNENTLWGDYNQENTQSYYNQVKTDELYDALKRYFPNLNFTLFIINYVEINNLPLNCREGIIEYKLRKNSVTLKKAGYRALIDKILRNNEL